jgi:hypothetical protein
MHARTRRSGPQPAPTQGWVGVAPWDRVPIAPWDRVGLAPWDRIALQIINLVASVAFSTVYSCGTASTATLAQ